MNTLVYSYGVLSLPRESLAILDAEISGGHKYYNNLIEIERWQLEEKQRLRSLHVVGLDEAEAALEQALGNLRAAREEIKARNAEARKKTAGAADRDLIRRLKDRLKEAKEVRKNILVQVKDNVAYTTALSGLHERLLERRREAYAAATCGWGTRLKIAQAVEGAMTVTDLSGMRRARSPQEPPRFRRWNGDGLAAIQVQKGVKVDRLLIGTDPRLQIRVVGRKRAVVSMRLGIGADREPLLLRSRIAFHRSLPDDAVVTWASLVRRRGPLRRMAGGVWKPWDSYELQLTVRTEEQKPCAASGRCGVDLGWRLMGDGRLRVAYWKGAGPLFLPDCLQKNVVLHNPDGSEGELRIEPSRWQKCFDLQSIRDGHRHDLQRALLGMLGRLEGSPDWLALATQDFALWRSPRRFCELADLSQSHAGEREDLRMIDTLLRQYRETEAHLWQWQRSQETKNRRYRLAVYRQFATCLARHYRLVAVEDCDWRTLNRLPEVESNEQVNTLARQHLRMASVGELRQVIKHSGAVVAFSETANTTRTCHGCGGLCSFDAGASLFHTCEHCGLGWDQDQNAASVLLARASTMIQTAAPAREPQEGNGEEVMQEACAPRGRWQRRKVARSQNEHGDQENPVS